MRTGKEAAPKGYIAPGPHGRTARSQSTQERGRCREARRAADRRDQCELIVLHRVDGAPMPRSGESAPPKKMIPSANIQRSLARYSWHLCCWGGVLIVAGPGLTAELEKEREGATLWTIALTLLVLWALGLVSSYTAGGLVHLLLVIASSSSCSSSLAAADPSDCAEARCAVGLRLEPETRRRREGDARRPRGASGR